MGGESRPMCDCAATCPGCVCCSCPRCQPDDQFDQPESVMRHQLKIAIAGGAYLQGLAPTDHRSRTDVVTDWSPTQLLAHWTAMRMMQPTNKDDA